MGKKIRLGLVFGGKSGEHEVSLVSARSIFNALDKKKYSVKLIGIDKKGVWRLGDAKDFWINPDDTKRIKLNLKSPKITVINDGKKVFLMNIDSAEDLGQIDVFFPIIHGTFGEDGTLQGFFEIVGTPYVGPGVLGSAIGMDKDIMKKLFQQAGIETANFFVLRKNNFKEKEIIEGVRKIKFPLFVKPANLGSSVGISKVKNKKDLKKAIRKAFQFDNKIILEEEIKGREIECSVLGNNDWERGPIASNPGEIKIKKGHYYSYDAKYIDDKIATPVPSADLKKEEIKKIKELAIKVFQVLECEGMGRVDFFLTEKGKIYANEINTLPGFTSVSMYPKMFEQSGIPYSKLLDILVELAIKREQRNEKLKRDYIV